MLCPCATYSRGGGGDFALLSVHPVSHGLPRDVAPAFGVRARGRNGCEPFCFSWPTHAGVAGHKQLGLQKSACFRHTPSRPCSSGAANRGSRLHLPEHGALGEACGVEEWRMLGAGGLFVLAVGWRGEGGAIRSTGHLQASGASWTWSSNTACAATWGRRGARATTTSA